MSNHIQSEQFETGRFKKIFDQIEIIGQGGFGQVYKAKHKIENQFYAIKKIYLAISQQQSIYKHKYFKEVSCLYQSNHINVIRYHTIWIEQPNKQFIEQFQKSLHKKLEKQQMIKNNKLQALKNDQNKLDSESMNNSGSIRSDSYDQLSIDHTQQNQSDNLSFNKSDDDFQNQDSSSELNSSEDNSNYSMIQQILPIFENEDQIPLILYIQMQYCPENTLKEYFEYRQNIDDQKCFNMFTQILNGVKFIHSKNIYHRDLKPTNIFIKDSKNLVIGDFGLSTHNFIDDGKDTQMTTNLGTPLYSAPEQLGSSKYDSKVDIYSLGLILFELYQMISTQMEKNQLINNLRTQQEFPKEFDKWKNQKLLILQMIQNNPKKRPNVDEILQSTQYIEWSNQF